MSRVGNNHLGALQVATTLMICTDNHQTCELAMCSGKWIESETAQAGDS